MDMIVNRNIIAGSKVKPEMVAGIAVMNGEAQIRQTDPRGKVTKDGRIALFAKDASGNEVIILLSPEEGATMGPVLTHLAWLTMGQPPPAIEVKVAPKLEIAQ